MGTNDRRAENSKMLLRSGAQWQGDVGQGLLFFFVSLVVFLTFKAMFMQHTE